MDNQNQTAGTGIQAAGDYVSTHPHYKRLPAYGKQLTAMRRAGKIPARMVIVTFDWELARAYPRIVIADLIGGRGV